MNLMQYTKYEIPSMIHSGLMDMFVSEPLRENMMVQLILARTILHAQK